MALVTCLIFTARVWNGKRSGETFVWAQLTSSNRSWYYPISLANEPEDDIENLPLSVAHRFQRLPPAHHRSRDVSAHRLGKVLMDEAELNRDWIAATPPDVVFREPKD
jgi:hypothetical protein